MAIAPPRPISIDLAPIRLALYGPSGFGKTHFLMNVPGLTIINLEKSADAFAKRFPGIRAIDIPKETIKEDVPDAIDAVLHGRKGFESSALGFDSITAFRRILQSLPRKSRGEYKDADVNDVIRTTLTPVLTDARVPIIITAHEKRAFTEDEKRLPNHAGMIPDADPRFLYSFDIVARLVSQNGKPGAVVVKTRFSEIPVHQFIPGFCWDYIMQKLGRAPARQPQANPPQAVPPAQKPAGDGAPPANQAPPDRERVLQAFSSAFTAAGSPEGKFVKWLHANDYPTDLNTIVADRTLCTRIYERLSALAPAS
jgi:AAA domain